MTAEPALSQLEYYRQSNFTPGGMELEDRDAWDSHVAKRLNLYQRHLGIPLSLLSGRSVLEIGCNFGENALVLAAAGAELTLVEPNDHAMPRLRELFRQFGLEHRISSLVQEDIRSFDPGESFDLVIAEGFMHTLPDRGQMLNKLATMLVPGGLGVISFSDLYGSLMEMTRRMVLWRACQLAGIDDVHSQDSLNLARALYHKDWERLNASRPFEMWVKDGLLTPLFTAANLWKYPEILPLLETTDCEFYSSSPGWASVDRFVWYKDVSLAKERAKRLLDQWAANLPFFLTGFPTNSQDIPPPPPGAPEAVEVLMENISNFAREDTPGQSPLPIESVVYPPVLDQWLGDFKRKEIVEFNTSFKRLLEVASAGTLHDLMEEYRTGGIGGYWGSGYHYLCFRREIQLDTHKS